mmetsp:Transcript_21375/g.50237  ORF Transcript_21375/g.50237 Transcript_21375/m.50237 type:complete len:138 (+) Transcript_21375:734-1147(+)
MVSTIHERAEHVVMWCSSDAAATCCPPVMKGKPSSKTVSSCNMNDTTATSDTTTMAKTIPMAKPIPMAAMAAMTMMSRAAVADARKTARPTRVSKTKGVAMHRTSTENGTNKPRAHASWTVSSMLLRRQKRMTGVLA